MPTPKKPLVETFSDDLQAKPKSIAEILRRVRLVLTNRHNWVKDTEFTRQNGNSCSREEARRVCLGGAFELVGGSLRDAARKRVLKILQAPEYGHFSIASFNDHEETKHGDVLRVLDAAIALS